MVGKVFQFTKIVMTRSNWSSFRADLCTDWAGKSFINNSICRLPRTHQFGHLETSTLRKLVFHILSNWMGYDRGDSFPFDFEPNGIPFSSKLKGKLSTRSYPIHCERKWKYSFLSVEDARLTCDWGYFPPTTTSLWLPLQSL